MVLMVSVLIESGTVIFIYLLTSDNFVPRALDT